MSWKSGASVATLLMVTACGPSSCSGDKPAQVAYSNIDDCMADGHDRVQCEDSYKAAQQNVPRFSAMGSCEAQYGAGNCVPRGNDSFAPFMTGYLLGSLGSSNRGVWVDRSYTPYTSGGTRVYNNTYIQTPSRGGFGGSSSSIGSYHSSGDSPSAISGGSISRGGFGGSAAMSASSGGE